MEKQNKDLEWKIACRLNSVKGESPQRQVVYNGFFNRMFKYNPQYIEPKSRCELEKLGFEIVDEYVLFYQVKPPNGWTIETERIGGDKEISTVFDNKATPRISQFYKNSSWDCKAFVDIL